MKELTICHVNGKIIGIATSIKQKYEIVDAYFDDLHQRHGSGQTVEFTYVKPNILFPRERNAIGGITDKALVL
ncbi:MAG: hypothetical protein J6Y20_04910 [Lachnospiraceae bacterium]|nr:hypothetical protein [Kiritimatiellia bacterium]MBP5461447.1 hypothetical protein [Lachnospiraceae bacterium]